MKRLSFIAILLFVVALVAAQTLGQPTASITLRVLDIDGKPVIGANVGAAFEVPKASGLGTKSVAKEGVTNEKGEYVASASTSSGYVSYGADKQGFYPTDNLKMTFQESKDGRWLPWNPTVEVVLKRIINPVPMYARKVNVEIPEIGKPCGYDLAVGDWVTPRGKGITNDFVFQAMRRFVSWEDFDSSVEITFSNKGDGLSAIRVADKPNQGSALRLPHNAPEGGYQAEIKMSIGRAPGAYQQQTAKEDMNYFFRVRTVLDGKGKVVSAQYGKIHGDFRLDPINSKTCAIVFTYYFNPTANDRNVESDPKRNLFENLSGLDRITAP